MQIGIVVPCYNEEAVLQETSKRLLTLLERLIASGKITGNSRIYFIDDGSRDQTWDMIEALSTEHPAVHGIKLSRNRGHQNALLAGLFTAEGDALISIDADLQDDIEVIASMVDRHLAGDDIVYGVRETRQSDTLFKRTTAEGFYKVMKLLGVDIIHNHADYRLMSRRSIEELKHFPEVNLFLRAMVPLVGYASSQVFYARAERFAGESKYPLKKMLSFAWDGITSFSIVPLRMISALGFLIFVAALVMSLWVLGTKLFTEEAIPGWASTVLPIYFIGGIQVLSIGIVGEYIGKMYLETKHRPRFIIEKSI